MQTEWILLFFGALMALGWSFVNGLHRRDPRNKNDLASSISGFPAFTKRKLQRLLAPSSFKDRLNHATVIAGCVFIIGTPIVVTAIFFGEVAWWKAPLLLIAGSLAGAYFGEAVFNSWGCSLDLPDESTHPPSTGADAPKG
jgi:hypothetical protein